MIHKHELTCLNCFRNKKNTKKLLFFPSKSRKLCCYCDREYYYFWIQVHHGKSMVKLPYKSVNSKQNIQFWIKNSTMAQILRHRAKKYLNIK